MGMKKSDEKKMESDGLREIPLNNGQSTETEEGQGIEYGEFADIENEAGTFAGETEKRDAKPTLEEELDEANKKIEELTDKYLRLHAEFDNYKKRNLKEKSELIRNGGARALESFLPVADDMERALAMMEKAEDINAMTEGIKLIHEKLLQVFTKNGLSVIETNNVPFDTDYHEAVAMMPASSEELKGRVIDCVQTGYKLNDKVLRHAKVVVAQ